MWIITTWQCISQKVTVKGFKKRCISDAPPVGTSKSPSYDVTIVIGDMNAQVGKEEMYHPTIGKQSLHEITNDNGYRLIQFATFNNMIIGSTMFQHKKIHKSTWTAPNRAFESQTDHIVIHARHM